MSTSRHRSFAINALGVSAEYYDDINNLPMTIESAKAKYARAAIGIREAIATEIPASFAGRLSQFRGVSVIVHLSGSIDVCGTAHLKSDDLAEGRAELAAAYRYYLDVRAAAKQIAHTMLPERVYVRQGAAFKRLDLTA